MILSLFLLLLTGCADFEVHPVVEYRGHGVSASMSYDPKAKILRPKVMIYDKNELKGLAK